MPVSEATLAEINDLIEIQAIICKICPNNFAETLATLDRFYEKYKDFIEHQIFRICNSMSAVKLTLFDEFTKKHNIELPFSGLNEENIKISRYFNEDNIGFLVEQSSTTNIAEAEVHYRYTSVSYLHLAAEAGAVKMFKYLLSEGCQPDKSTMAAAIRGGSLEIIQILTQSGFSAAQYASTAITWNRNEIYEWISNNNDVEIDFNRNMYEIIPGNIEFTINYIKSLTTLDERLLKSIITQDIPIYIKFILESEFSIENKDEIMDYAITSRKTDIAIILNQYGFKITHFFENAILAIEDHDEKLWKLLVDNGLDIKIRHEKSEMTFLHIAVKKGFVAKIDQLIKDGIDVNSKDAAGKTPLMYASENNNPIIVEKLLGHGADVNILDNAGETAIFYAASQGLTGIIKILFDHGAKANLTSKRGHTPYMLANFINKGAAELINEHLKNE
ncbi:hypothetical protein TVAG_208640 [Trichomonas vaginalis G3]|uniref:Uncharacterized protein n=1 Tax=Trichomonas vaginalis (strain ATCC PRA-98 / G3) TaxID=412133 RepID=A2F364_TRIV3|nr:protein kinase protein [Trichomonas vaginalis G3]EAY00672.1 hypothetical protein TVAG_208640 [Trichomonas vaginalis G3]KAI5487194.1 protein kinase protein [Trichomonas vaginalis G3]|eukprot:XP_001313601.1 hypothetical protein [Trichomonas vaginalis G3]